MRMALGLPFALVGPRRLVVQERRRDHTPAHRRTPCRLRARPVLTGTVAGAKETRRYGFGLGRFMSIEIKMPALSPTMEEGTLAKWLVKEGDTVKSGDLMAEIETDKATMEFEAVDEGVIGK